MGAGRLPQAVNKTRGSVCPHDGKASYLHDASTSEATSALTPPPGVSQYLSELPFNC
jgi:hypothetical protein